MPHASTAPAATDVVVRGIGFMLLSTLLFSGMDALVKWLSADYPIGQIVFFRGLFAFIPLAFLIRQSGGLTVLRTKRPGGHLWRGVVGVAAMSCTFVAVALMPLADAIALARSGPLFLTALSVPLLGEKVGVRRWSAVIIGFIGVLVMMRPGAAVFDPAAFVAIAAAFLYALAMIAIRRLGRTESSATIVFYFTLFATVISGLFLPFQWVTPDVTDFLLLASIGLVGGVAQIAMTQAFRLAPVAVVGPFEYATLVFAIGFGYLLWRDVPDAFLLTGAAIVVGSGLYILHRETMLRQQRRRAR